MALCTTVAPSKSSRPSLRPGSTRLRDCLPKIAATLPFGGVA